MSTSSARQGREGKGRVSSADREAEEGGVCSPFSIFLSLVCTLPLKFTTLRVGLTASSCACLRREADPITEPSGRSLMVSYFLQMNTSLVSSRMRLQGRMVPSGSQVGTSFIECTHRST
jgi:hypothetical protein